MGASGVGAGTGAGMGRGTNNLSGGNTGYPAGQGQGQFGGGYGAGNMGPGAGAGGATHSPLPPRTDAYGNPEHPTAGSKLAGKVETIVGEVLGSSTLKQHGLQRQQ